MPAVGNAPYNTIAIVNKSTMMSDNDGRNIVVALNSLLPTFCSNWNIKPISAIYVASGASAPAGTPLRCIVLDNSDVQGALGYHDEVSDVPYAKVFVKTILSNGGAILYSPNPQMPTLSQTISHEVFEMIADPNANLWWGSADGNTLYAGEVCDAVEGNSVKVIISASTLPKVTIAMSDWVLPAWADPQAKTGPYNHNNTIKKPLTCDVGGYLITLNAGNIVNVFGSNIGAYAKANMSERVVNRVGTKPLGQPITLPAPAVVPKPAPKPATTPAPAATD